VWLKIGVRERVRMVGCRRVVCAWRAVHVVVSLSPWAALGSWVRNVGSLLCVVLHVLVIRGCCEVPSFILVLRDDDTGPCVSSQVRGMVLNLGPCEGGGVRALLRYSE
jgi:hypothetical protein